MRAASTLVSGGIGGGCASRLSVHSAEPASGAPAERTVSEPSRFINRRDAHPVACPPRFAWACFGVKDDNMPTQSRGHAAPTTPPWQCAGPQRKQRFLLLSLRAGNVNAVRLSEAAEGCSGTRGPGTGSRRCSPRAAAASSVESFSRCRCSAGRCSWHQSTAATISGRR